MKTVLIVDDEFGIAEALSALLSDEGYRVFTAPNGKLGLLKMEEIKPDLLIIDYMMPVLDGAKMLEQLRQDDRYKELPVVLMSGVAEAIVQRECQGYSAYLRKPFTADKVLAALDRLLKR